MKRPKWPWVRRAVLETTIGVLEMTNARADEMRNHLRDAEREKVTWRERSTAEHLRAEAAEKRAEMADLRAKAAEERAVRVMENAQLVIADALRLSQTAAKTLFGVEESGDIDPAPSVRTADRDYARRQRESQERGR